MKIEYSFEELEIQKAVRKFVKNDLLPNSKEIDRSGKCNEDIRKKFLSLGLLKTVFPEQYGGVNGTITGLIIALKELSYASFVPAWGLFENFMLAYPLFHYGSEYLRSSYLPAIISLDTTGAFAFTEPDTGSDPVQLKTVAKKVDGGYVLNGSKRFITNSGICDHLIVFVRLGENVAAFFVESNKDGYRVGKRESFIQGSNIDNGDVYLEDYFASDNYMIGKVGQGFEILLRTETVGKVLFCSLFAGLAERAVDLATQYAISRSHRGKSIGHRFQMTQVKLARMFSKMQAINACLFNVSAKMERGEDIFWDAASLKLFVAQEVKEITSDAMEIHGAYGLSNEYDIGSLYRTAISAQVVMGSLDIQRVIVAKGMLDKLCVNR